MIISSTTDYRAAAQKRLPPFLFHYLDGGAYAEKTLARNVDDLADVALRQRAEDALSQTPASSCSARSSRFPWRWLPWG
jgi:L-lactate dehydrogenase (cytochrome)